MATAPDVDRFSDLICGKCNFQKQRIYEKVLVLSLLDQLLVRNRLSLPYT
jgi:hypothetical protein